MNTRSRGFATNRAPGDLLAGDGDDGIVAVPAHVEAAALAAALGQVRAEGGCREAVRGGTAPPEAFDRFNVL